MTYKVCQGIASLAAAVAFVAPLPLSAQQADRLPAEEQSTFTLKVTSELVLTNVVVRNKKTGEIVRGLTAKDFTVQEDGKPQQVTDFDFESVDQAPQLNGSTISGKSPGRVFAPKNSAAVAEELHNRRLIVFFFDITSMQPDDLARAQEAARNYLHRQMQPADLVAVVSLANTLSLDQDFTDDKQRLVKAVNGYAGTEEPGYQLGATSTTNQAEDTTSFTPDESEYNNINTDRELFAIEEVSKSLAYINEKKSLLYFSGGIQRNGIENQASLHAAVNTAVRANLSIYSVDSRGLQAISPLGDATTGSLRGTSAYNGAALQNIFDTNFNTQEVMATLSNDTGGKAFFDSNDFSPAFERIQHDTSAYYVLGYHSNDMRRDGRFRRLTIKVARNDVKLEYRPGYYAPADFQHSTKDDRERELREQLSSDLPATDVAVYLQALDFRVDAARYYVPISLLVPGSQIPFVKGGDRDKATLDVIGQIKDTAGHDVGDVRETVELAIDESQQVRQRNIQYSTNFTLPVGAYHVKFVVRENETGHMGSFEADFNVLDLRKAPLKMSSVVLASQRIPAAKKGDSPLIRDGLQLVPNLPHVFRRDQHLYLLYEVYDPTHSRAEKGNSNSAKTQVPAAPVRVFTSIEFLEGNTIAFETPAVQAADVNVPTRDAIAFEFDVPLSDLKPGLYTCQINVVDDAGGAFSFPRTGVLVRDTPGMQSSPAGR
ncbi:MAG: VWA domain-containing protein [Terriglobia bacterium]